MLNVNPRKSHTITYTERKDNALFLYSEWGIIRVKPQTEYIVRVSCVEQGKDFLEKTGMGINFCKSFSNWSYRETETLIVVTLPKLIIEITKKNGSFTYLHENKRLLLSESKKESKFLDEFDSYKTIVDEDTEIEEVVTPDGIKQVIRKATKVFDKKLYHTRLTLEF